MIEFLLKILWYIVSVIFLGAILHAVFYIIFIPIILISSLSHYKNGYWNKVKARIAKRKTQIREIVIYLMALLSF